MPHSPNVRPPIGHTGAGTAAHLGPNDGRWLAGPTEDDDRTVAALENARAHCANAWVERDSDGALSVYGSDCR